MPDSNSDMDPDLAIGLYSKCYRKQKHISTFKELELKVSFWVERLLEKYLKVQSYDASGGLFGML